MPRHPWKHLEIFMGYVSERKKLTYILSENVKWSKKGESICKNIFHQTIEPN